MKKKLLIFDLDGTLVDSSVDIMNAINHAIEPFLGRTVSLSETIGLVGEGITRLIEKLVGEDRIDIHPKVLERFMLHYTGHLSDNSVPYEGVRETLAALSGFRKAVVSNKREFLSKKLLDDLGLMNFFDVVLGSDSVDERKPSPKPILHTLSLFSVSPAEGVVIGDSNYDIEAGRAAGVTTVAVSYGFRDVSLLQDADFIIDRFGDLKDIVRQWES